jgi:hypothetical protein
MFSKAEFASSASILNRLLGLALHWLHHWPILLAARSLISHLCLAPQSEQGPLKLEPACAQNP